MYSGIFRIKLLPQALIMWKDTCGKYFGVRKYCSWASIFIITKEKLGQVYPKNCEAFPQVTNTSGAFKTILD